MATYKVRWEIDLEADSLIGAAQRAQEIQRNPESIASFFEVKRSNSKHWKLVDLLDKEGPNKFGKPLTMKQWQQWKDEIGPE